ncbi:VOC family protein [Streptomyces sp. NPDC001617]
MALTAAGLAFTQRQSAVDAQRTALSRQLAAQSAGLLDTNPDLASLLAVQSYRMSPTAEAVTSLYTAAALPLRQRLTGHSAQVWTVTFSPDGHTLATASDDETIRLWDTATGRARATLAGHGGAQAAVAFAPDGRTPAAGGESGVQLWDVATGTIRARFPGHGQVLAVAFVPGEGRTEISLKQPGPPLHDDATAEQLRELITRGALGGLVFNTDDAWGLYETLKARGVTDVTQEPTDHFYGTDMGLRDPFGNAIRIVEQGNVPPETTA